MFYTQNINAQHHGCTWELVNRGSRLENWALSFWYFRELAFQETSDNISNLY